MQEETAVVEKKETKSEVKEKETPSRRKESRDSRDSKDSKSEKKEKETNYSKETKDSKRDDKKTKDKWIVNSVDLTCIYLYILYIYSPIALWFCFALLCCTAYHISYKFVENTI